MIEWKKSSTQSNRNGYSIFKYFIQCAYYLTQWDKIRRLTNRDKKKTIKTETSNNNKQEKIKTLFSFALNFHHTIQSTNLIFHILVWMETVSAFLVFSHWAFSCSSCNRAGYFFPFSTSKQMKWMLLCSFCRTWASSKKQFQWSRIVLFLNNENFNRFIYLEINMLDNYLNNF